MKLIIFLFAILFAICAVAEETTETSNVRMVSLKACFHRRMLMLGIFWHYGFDRKSMTSSSNGFLIIPPELSQCNFAFWPLLKDPPKKNSAVTAVQAEVFSLFQALGRLWNKKSRLAFYFLNQRAFFSIIWLVLMVKLFWSMSQGVCGSMMCKPYCPIRFDTLKEPKRVSFLSNVRILQRMMTTTMMMMAMMMTRLGLILVLMMTRMTMKLRMMPLKTLTEKLSQLVPYIYCNK